MIGLVAGASYPGRALAILRRTPHLWRYVFIPILVNVVVAAIIYAALLIAGLRAIDGLIAGLPGWAAALGFLLRLLLVVALFIVIGFVVARFGVVLGSPWYARLSAHLERMGSVEPVPVEAGGLRAAIGDLGRAVTHEAKKLTLVVAISLPLLALNVIPGFGSIIATLGGIALGATVACLDFLDAPLERRRLRFREKLAVIARGFPASAGFGLVCFALVSVPFLNLLAIPVCVAAGTLFYTDQAERLLDPRRR